MFVICSELWAFGSDGYYLHYTDEEAEARRDRNLGLRPCLSNSVSFP